jgi:hypothetical protein
MGNLRTHEGRRECVANLPRGKAVAPAQKVTINYWLVRAVATTRDEKN